MVSDDIVEMALDEIAHTPEDKDPEERINSLCRSVATTAYEIVLRLVSSGYKGTDTIEKAWKLAEEVIIQSDNYHAELLTKIDEKIIEESSDPKKVN